MKSIADNNNAGAIGITTVGQKIHDDPLTKIGRRIPWQMIAAVQDELLQKALNWLKENGAPDEISQAFSNADMLQIYATKLMCGQLSDIDAMDLPDTLFTASELAIKFGGSFLEWNAGDPQISSINKDV